MAKFYFPYFDDTNQTIVNHPVMFAYVPFMGEESYSKIQRHVSIYRSGLYNGLVWYNGKVHQNVDSYSECDYVVIPIDLKHRAIPLRKILSESKPYGKQVLCFYSNDSAKPIVRDENAIVYRTSAFASRMLKNERIYPHLACDHFPKTFELTDVASNKDVSFMGVINGDRKNLVSHLRNIYPNANITINNSYFYSHGNKFNLRKKFISSFLRDSFAFCPNGSGNFSFRFYEALCFGRIPIFIDNDNMLPFERIIDWNKHIIRIRRDDFLRLSKRDFCDIINTCNVSPLGNRRLWERYFSAEGYFENFTLDI